MCAPPRAPLRKASGSRLNNGDRVLSQGSGLMIDHIEIDGVQLYLSRPDDSAGEWIGQREILKHLLACWLTVDERDLPLAPRIIGTPGIGKTTLAIAAGRARQQHVYIYQCTADTRPEDLLVTPVLAES